MQVRNFVDISYQFPFVEYDQGSPFDYYQNQIFSTTPELSAYIARFDLPYSLSIGINEVSENAWDFIVYPNPACNEVYYLIPLENHHKTKLCLYNNLGQELMSRDLSRESGTVMGKINLSGYAKGMYLLKAEADGEFTTKKFLIE